jgi:hypothetical protein
VSAPSTTATQTVTTNGFDLVGYVLRTAPTPARLRWLLGLVWALSLILFLVGEDMLVGAWTAMKTVGKDAAPSIIDAQDINYALADIDANAGNYLLGTRTHQDAAMRSFEQRRSELTATLLHAAGNITYGDAERVPIGQLFDNLGRYLELVSQMRYQKDQGDAQGALVTYGAATDLMHTRLVPAADALDAANRGFLDHKYDEQQAESEGAGRIAGGVGGLVVLALLAGQLYLYRRTRRVFNVALLAATVVAGAFTGALVARINDARDDLKVAKKDAFDSIHALSKARAIAGDANGDETRWLLGGPGAAKFEQAYHDKVRKIASVPEPAEKMITATPVPQQYQGLFADEMRNITFPGERDAALKMIHAFAKYDAIDVKIRKLEADHKHDAAVELCIGSGADESNAAFDEFGDALKKVILINHVAFDYTVNHGMDDLALTEKILPFASIAIALLAFLGLRSRLKEYSA